MQERLQEILEKEHLTPARFAELIGVQRSSVSHILSGRNNPSLDFLQKILLHLEHINPDWLISGRGSYKRSQVRQSSQIKASKEASSASTNSPVIEFPEKATEKGPVKDENRSPYFRKKQQQRIHQQEEPPNKPDASIISNNDLAESDRTHASKPDSEIHQKQSEKNAPQEKRIVKTVFFYDDQTFEVFYPSS